MPQQQITTPTLMVHGMLKDGKSFSGREPNCCFWNTRGERFGDVSAVSGLDFDDDGRAAGVVDWDFDGDPDLWFVNRSGPQVRFLRNDVPQANHWLALLLKGTTCNRDAIGARVEVYLDPQGTPLIKTLRAGDGFLSQSSKWLHFGLGASAEIDRVVVRWPGGEPQTLAGLRADRRYRVVQGQAEPREWTPPPGRVQLKPTRLPRSTASDPPRVVLTEPVPLPPLDYQRPDGLPGAVPDVLGRPTLLCLWASWCRPCVTELGELQQHREQLQQAGVDVLALSVDGLNDKSPDTRPGRELLQRIGFELPTGFAPAELAEVLQAVQDELFDRRRPLGLPCSFLLDGQGRLGAIYRGPVEAAQVARDAALLALPPEQLREAALPFQGTWVEVPAPRRLLPIVRHLRASGLVRQAWNYVEAHGTLLRGDPELPGLLLELGDDLMAARRVRDGVDAFHAAAAAAPDSPRAHFTLGQALIFSNDPRGAAEQFRRTAELDPLHADARQQLAWILATSRDPKLQDLPAAVRWAEEAVRLSDEKDAGILDTLAVAYGGLQRFDEALKTERKALVAAQATGANPELMEELRTRIRQFEYELRNKYKPSTP